MQPPALIKTSNNLEHQIHLVGHARFIWYKWAKIIEKESTHAKFRINPELQPNEFSVPAHVQLFLIYQIRKVTNTTNSAIRNLTWIILYLMIQI